MGIVFALSIILIYETMKWSWRTITGNGLSSDDQNTAAKISVIMANGGYNFEDIILALEKLSPKARATFAYLYVSSISKDKRLFGTVRRYIDMKAAGIVVPQKPKGKGL